MKIKYTSVDGENTIVEVDDAIGTFIVDSRRIEENANRKERYHCYSIEGAVYEGEDYASNEDIQLDYIQREDNSDLYDALGKLSEPQRRRLIQVADGISMQEIARIEGVGYNSVYKSIDAARKKLKKILKMGD